MIKVFMGIPSTGQRSDSQCYQLRAIERKFKDKVQFVYPEECIHISFHDAARNHVVTEFLKSDCDVLWFLDSDNSPPETVLDNLIEKYADWQVAGAPCPIWSKPANAVYPQVMFNVYDAADWAFRPTYIPEEGIYEIEGLGTGCMLIKREVFSQIPAPYFEFKFNDVTRSIDGGEDLNFCKKLNAAGIKILVDFKQVCKHYKNICLLDVNNYAINAINMALRTYQERLSEGARQHLLAKKLSLR